MQGIVTTAAMMVAVSGVFARDEFWDGPSHKPLGQSTAPPEMHM